ncbi:hypothetical protein L6164_016971 [Bauhinia variegata]|uniref:Uncharacterized protein n=1 Tax=Bauhinia variegata TaxID=167791 RepID=A0ACB9NBH4_BAUVA|nr:hypothetical protein L6164_016971 [Bauhinia variegata]
MKAAKEQDKGNGSVSTIAVTEESGSTAQDLIAEKKSLPPLVSALKATAEVDVATFHFPGHNRGHAAPSSLIGLIGLKPFLYDLNGLPELGTLSCPRGAILEAQKEAAKLFGSSETRFLVGGTTCGIQAAIMATCSPGESLILARNSHSSAISAMVLSGALPKYIIPEYNCNWDIATYINPLDVRRAIEDLEREGRRARAVFITSPTYHGVCSSLSEISELCHSHHIPLIVDEAHGAHFKFHPQLPDTALEQGADLAVQSTHKVLCSLGQSSMLHMSGNIIDRDRVCKCLQTLQTTSPSHLLLASLDAARAQLGESPDSIFNQAMELAYEARFLLKQIPGISVLEDFNFPGYDPMRLTVGVWQIGFSGHEADEILHGDHGIVAELVGNRYITFAFNLGTRREHIQRLVSGIKQLATASKNQIKEKVEHTSIAPFVFDDIVISLSPRDAFFATKRRVALKESLGRVSGELICPYPPAIPVLIPGEVITEKALDYLLLCQSKGAFITGASDPSLSSIVVCHV